MALCCSKHGMTVQTCIWVANAWFCPVPFELFCFSLLLISTMYCWLICHYLCPSFCRSFIVIYFIYTLYFFTYFASFFGLLLHSCCTHSLMFSFPFFPSSHFSSSVLPSWHLSDRILTHTYNQRDSNFRNPVFHDVTLRRCWSVYEPAEGTYFLSHLPQDPNPQLQHCKTFKTHKTEICYKLLIP